MKKNLLLAIMLVGIGTTAYKAQTSKGVGINTDAPAATLDVKASITAADNNVPDAVLVPRMTRAQLLSKDNTSGTYGAPQNGALVYITAIDGTVTTRTTKVTAVGFHYFDNTVPEWKPFGGSSTPVPTAMNVTDVKTASYAATATDDIVLLNINSSGQTLTLPTTGIEVGKRYYVNNIGINTVDLIPSPIGTGNTSIPSQQGAMLIFAGTTVGWIYLSAY